MHRSVSGRILFSHGLKEHAARLTRVVATVQPKIKSVSLTEPGEAIQLWQSSLGSFDPMTKVDHSPDANFEAFVTSDANDCCATYAVFTARVPVLYLRDPSGIAPGFASPSHPFVTTASFNTDSDMDTALETFLTFPKEAGRVFVVEGGDGAGKETQVALMMKRLRDEGYPCETIDYPNDRAKYGVLIREILFGHRGSIRKVNPLVFAALYGINREDHRPLLNYWLLRGVNVVLDRYMTANWGHQASKFATDDERKDAIEALRAFEQDWLDLPPPHRTAYLNLPPMIAMKAMTNRAALDEHEKAGMEYKDKVRRSFLWCCEHMPGWNEVKCADEAQEIRLTRQEVHNELWRLWGDSFVNKSLRPPQ